MREPPTCPVPDPGARRRSGREAKRLRDLVRRTGTGDTLAFSELYDALSPLVYGTALRVVADAALAAEVCQEVMFEVWTKARRYDPAAGTVYAWAATVAHRRSVDVVRSEVARRRREERSVRDREVDATADELLRSEDAERVRGCLETLTELENEALVAAYYGGRSYAEVAEHLASPLATVKSRIRAALNRMRGCLEGV